MTTFSRFSVSKPWRSLCGEPKCQVDSTHLHCGIFSPTILAVRSTRNTRYQHSKLVLFPFEMVNFQLVAKPNSVEARRHNVLKPRYLIHIHLGSQRRSWLAEWGSPKGCKPKLKATAIKPYFKNYPSGYTQIKMPKLDSPQSRESGRRSLACTRLGLCLWLSCLWQVHVGMLDLVFKIRVCSVQLTGWTCQIAVLCQRLLQACFCSLELTIANLELLHQSSANDLWPQDEIPKTCFWTRPKN